MTLVAFGSIAGSPGVTRLAIGLAGAWPEGGRRIVVEADPDGGRLGAELGIGVEPGLMAVAIAARARPLTAEELLMIGAAAVGPWYAVAGPPSGEQASSVLTHASSTLADAMRVADDHVWLVDAGRLSTRSPALPFARAADRTVVVTSGTFPALLAVPARIEALRQAGCDAAVVVVEPTSWRTSELADFVGADVLAVLPRVRHGERDEVGAMTGSSWRGWWREVGRLAGILAGAGAGAGTHDTDRPDAAPPVAPVTLDSGPRWPG